MKKYIFLAIVAVISAWFLVDGFNSAYAGGPPNLCSIKPWLPQCDRGDEGEGGDIDIEINNKPVNKAYGGNAKAIAGAAAFGFFDVDNEIDVDQKQNQKQNQAQKQTALAIQGQIGINKNDNSNKGNKQNTKVIVEGDSIVYEAEYNHIPPVSGPDTDTNTVKSNGHDALTKGSIMDKLKGLSLDGIKLAAKDADDVRILAAVFFEPKESVNYMRIGTDGEFAGYLYGDCDDDECSAAGMEAKAMEKAAELGYTSIERVHNAAGEKLYASEWSVKIGGGASVAADGGRMMIAPGGGVGGGAAESSTVQLPAMTFEVYYNPLFINVK